MPTRKSFCGFALFAMLCVSTSAHGQEMGGEGGGKNVAQLKMVSFPGLPTCTRMSVVSGDPTKGPAIILARAGAGCVIPWHWHTPNERLMMVSGAARLEMKDGKPFTLQPGGFALMPSRHVHQFTCLRACLLYIDSDVAFDLHYVNYQGSELTPGAALKKVKEVAATEMR